MRNTVYSVQALRAVAAVMVVTFHAQALLNRYESSFGIAPTFLNSTPSLREIGASGVDIFFVISGFVMALTTSGTRGSYKYVISFFKRRLIRIVPLYWFYTLIMAVLLFFFPHFFSTARFSLWETLLSLSFFPYTPSVNPTAPILEVGWSLSYEMYFYIIVAAGLFVRQWYFAFLLGLLFSSCVFFVHSLSFASPLLMLVGNAVLFEFFAGFICGSLYVSGLRVPRFLPPFFLLVGIVGYVLLACGILSINAGLLATFVVGGSVFLESQWKIIFFPRWIVDLGDSSYSLYLSHYLLLPVLGKICTTVGFWSLFSSGYFVIFAVPACVIVGEILYICVERFFIGQFCGKLSVFVRSRVGDCYL